METIALSEYNIYIAKKFNELDTFAHYLQVKNYSSIYVLIDTNTEEYCLGILSAYMHTQSMQVICIQAGESEKHIDTCKIVWNELVNKHADRKSLLINLGGGVIGDMGGFVASTFKRGFDFINIPTTLLAQVDASVGGKLAVDFNDMKNIIGVFNNPQAVFIATEFLHTLPKEQLVSGYAEVLKHGLIKNKVYWNETKNIDIAHVQDWADIIKTSVGIKKEIVDKDPYEMGLRKILNFGHTIGHAVETLSLKTDAKPLLHGEAIAIGMIAEAWLSKTVNNLSDSELQEISICLLTYFAKYPLDKMPFEALMKIMMHDKKNSDNSIKFSLLSTIGNCDYDIHVDANLIQQSLNYYSTL